MSDTGEKIVLGLLAVLAIGLSLGLLLILVMTAVGIPMTIAAVLAALFAASLAGILSGIPTVINNYRDSVRENSYKEISKTINCAWQKNIDSIRANNIRSKDPDSKVLPIIRFLDRSSYTITVFVFGIIVTLTAFVIYMLTSLVLKIIVGLGHLIWKKNRNNSN